MNGKDKCKYLKKLRKKIAELNEISLKIEDCKFKGECKGTCPKCDREAAYLMTEILKRQKAGKPSITQGVLDGDELKDKTDFAKIYEGFRDSDELTGYIEADFDDKGSSGFGDY